MSSTGTRVVPTLTEVLDEQRLAKPSTPTGTDGWQNSRPGDEEFVPISLDWGDEPTPAGAEDLAEEEGGIMTPWQVVRSRGTGTGTGTGEAPFIDLSIDVAPVRPPALHEQVLEVYAPLPAVAAASPAAVESPDAGLPAVFTGQEALADACEAAPRLPPDEPPAPDMSVPLDSMPAPALPAFLPEAVASAAMPAGPAPVVLDPGASAVRQGPTHVPGISEERLQAILQQALDRLLRDELPSALVETLIRLSPQLSESLIESLKPSLHLHVMEALSAEPAGAPDGRSPG